MYDVNCPYCRAHLDINHDDGYGYAEDEIFFQECRECGKTFKYTTIVSYTYDVEKAPCQNGGQHDLKQKLGYPEELYVGLQYCTCCGEEFITDKEAYIKARKEYCDSLSVKVKEQNHEKV